MKRKRKVKQPNDGPIDPVSQCLWNAAGMSQTFVASPPLTTEQRLDRLEKQAVKFNGGYYVGSEPPTLVERVDWLFKYLSLEFKTTPGTPPVTNLVKKWWWE